MEIMKVSSHNIFRVDATENTEAIYCAETICQGKAVSRKDRKASQTVSEHQIPDVLLIHMKQQCNIIHLTTMTEQNDRTGALIPVIDLNEPNAAHELLDAACQYGFIFIKHNDLGLTPAEVDSLFNLVDHLTVLF